jgi:sirohydrochlorin ferrochelatase
MPILLLTAAHAKKDIPEEIEHVAKNFPEVSLKYGDPLGAHVRMADAIFEKVMEKTDKIADDSAIVIVGRGSSDPAVKLDLNEIKALLQKNHHVSSVYTCFLTAATPSLEDSLYDLSKSDYKNIIIVPYLLFTGILMKSIQKHVKTLEKETNKNWIVTDYLNDHPFVYEVLAEKIAEAKEKGRYVYDSVHD